MRSTLQLINASDCLELDLIVTGMHLLAKYGNTVEEIASSGLSICAKVPVTLGGNDGSDMAIALGQQIVGMTQALLASKADIVLLLGDRGEMLAGAIAALHLNIPIVHIHGGELSGTVDESIRHAISKLSHYHFTSTEESRHRLLKMGERPEKVFVTGAPGIDEILSATMEGKAEIYREYGLEENLPTALVLFHPVVQQAKDSEWQAGQLMDAVIQSGVQALVIMPNADAGGDAIRKVMRVYGKSASVVPLVHLPRLKYLSLLSAVDVMVGNSSSGIIEAASLKTAVVNVGDRQSNRERNDSVIDVDYYQSSIYEAIKKALEMDCSAIVNRYGDGNAGQAITRHLTQICLDYKILEKLNAY